MNKNLNTKKFKIFKKISFWSEFDEDSNIKPERKGTFRHCHEKPDRKIDISLHEL